MTFLTPHLPFGGPSSSFEPTAPSSKASQAISPPPGSHLIVSDTLNSPAHFVLFHLVLAANAAKRRVVWVDFSWFPVTGSHTSNDNPSWTWLNKQGSSLPPSFTHISPTPLKSVAPNDPSLFDDSDNPSLAAVAATLKSNLADSPLILLDGLSELLWMGFTPKAVDDFVREILSSCRETGSSLVSTIHADGLPLDPLSPSNPVAPVPDRNSPEVNLLFRLVRLAGGGWWKISNLASGRSGDVHGEITAYPLIGDDGAPRRDFPTVPQAQPLQYRLESNAVKVFPKGTGRGFL